MGLLGTVKVNQIGETFFEQSLISFHDQQEESYPQPKYIKVIVKKQTTESRMYTLLIQLQSGYGFARSYANLPFYRGGGKIILLCLFRPYWRLCIKHRAQQYTPLLSPLREKFFLNGIEAKDFLAWMEKLYELIEEVAELPAKIQISVVKISPE